MRRLESQEVEERGDNRGRLPISIVDKDGGFCRFEIQNILPAEDGAGRCIPCRIVDGRSFTLMQETHRDDILLVLQRGNKIIRLTGIQRSTPGTGK